MARIETWFNQEIMEPVKVQYIDGNVFCDDNNGNLIGVKMFKNGSPLNLTGSIIAYCVLATGVSIPVAGTISANTAFVILPSSVYSVPGPINIIIKNINSSDITTIAAVVSSVIGVGDIVGDPSQQTIDAWTAQINATITALQNGAVRYDTSQSLTTDQKLQARENIGANTSVVQISGEDYRIVIP